MAIYLLSLAEMTGIDLQDQIEAKMTKNAARVYQPLPNGVLAKRNADADLTRPSNAPDKHPPGLPRDHQLCPVRFLGITHRH